MISVRPRAPLKALVLFAGVAAFGALAPAQAQPGARPPIVGKVESLQTPAWVERGGIKASIKAGWAIFAGDRVFTGPEGRVQLALVGDGKLKLGGSTNIEFNANVATESGQDVPLFDVRSGAFHFTAPMVSRPDAVGTSFTLARGAAANVRGGQVFGKEDTLCLIDGLATVSGRDKSLVTLKEPQTVANVSPAGKALSPIPVQQERLAQWLSLVQPVGGHPVLQADGVWDVSLNSGYNLRELETMACRVQKRGFPSEIYPVREPGKQVWYRVVVRRFATKADAVGFLGIAKELGAKEPWVLLPQT
jgi:hypothetical protein